MHNVFKVDCASKFHDALVNHCIPKVRLADHDVQYPYGVDKNALIRSFFDALCCGILKVEERNAELAYYYLGINDAMNDMPWMPEEENDKLSSIMLKKCRLEMSIWVDVITFYDENGIVPEEDILHVARDLDIDMDAA